MKKACLLISLGILFFYSCTGQHENKDRGYIVNIGDTAPDFKMELVSGEKVSLSQYNGKVVMLQFTASWCGVCRREMPYIEEEIWQVLKDNDNFALLAIDRDEPRETVIAYSNKVGISYPIGLDPGADIFTRYAEREAGITRNVIINREGKIIFLTRMFDKKEFNEMKEVIFKELGYNEQ